MNIAVSMGDPAGIGPEIAIKAWLELKNNNDYKFVIFGDFDIISKYVIELNIEINLIKLENPNQEFDFSKSLAIYEPVKIDCLIETGIPNKNSAFAILKYIESACEHTLNGNFCAITTLPISKAPLYDAGFQHKGHTEFIAQLCEHSEFKNTFGPVMMLMIDGLKVALATIHIPLKDVSKSISIENIFKTIKIAHEAMQFDFQITKPKIAILGLNPHAGEDGTLGKEEIEIINPACQMARDIGIDCTNAIPADSGFSSDKRQFYDIYIAMYHDQGLIPIKALDFWGGVNVTLGLPLIRTSPDHGTGFEIAGKNIANPQSFINALKVAKSMAISRAQNE